MGRADEMRDSEGKGLYVSKETTQAWLRYDKVLSRYTGFGIMLLLLARIPLLVIPDHKYLSWGLGIGMAAAGLVIVIVTCLKERGSKYKVLKRNVLIFDNRYLVRLRKRYHRLKKKYIWMIVISFIIIAAGASGVLIFDMKSAFFYYYQIIYTFVAVIAIFTIFYSFSMMSAYELLTENEKYRNGMYFKLVNRRKQVS